MANKDVYITHRARIIAFKYSASLHDSHTIPASQCIKCEHC